MVTLSITYLRESTLFLSIVSSSSLGSEVTFKFLFQSSSNPVFLKISSLSTPGCIKSTIICLFLLSNPIIQRSVITLKGPASGGSPASARAPGPLR